MMKLIQLQYFCTVCQCLHMTRAAGQLHISQPSLSAAIKELEEEFGVALFIRSPKGLVLTDEGCVLASLAVPLLKQAEVLESTMRSLGKTAQRITLGVSPMIETLIFTELFQRFRQAYPYIHVDVAEHGTITNCRLLKEGVVDAALISAVGEISPVLESCRLASFPIYAYVAPSHPLATRSCVTFREVSALPLAILGEDSFMTALLQKLWKEAHIEPRIVIQTNQIASIQRLVESGTAGTLLFQQVLLCGDTIVSIPVKDLPPVDVLLAWKRANVRNQAVKALIRFAKKEYHVK